MTKYIQNNNTVNVVNIAEGFLQDTFTPAIYTVKQDMFGGYFLEHSFEKFSLPSRIYGSTKARTEKIFNSYQQRKGTTGVLLTGLKGSGKTLLMKSLANHALSNNIPVITINERYYGNDFMNFINNLGECVLLFDEFAKTYDAKSDDDYDKQDTLLTLFDGVASSKKLIVLSENNYHHINEFYKNRPSRIYYSFKYEKLEKEVIEEYSKDNLINKNFIPDIVKVSEKTTDFSFDVLQAIIEECNRYPTEQFQLLINDLNLSITEIQQFFQVQEITYQQVKGKPKIQQIPFDDYRGELIYSIPDKNIQNRYIYLNENNLQSSVDNLLTFEEDGVTVTGYIIKFTDWKAF